MTANAIKKGHVVTLAYVLKDDSGQVLDEAEADNPFAYLHGYGQIVPGLERALEGKSTGDKLQVSLEPADAYGELDPSLKLKIERRRFPAGIDLEEGMRFQAQLQEDADPIVFRIDGFEGQHVLVDGNHPLAGVRLHFAVEVKDVRDATSEELAHGHAHGPDGHHH